MPFLFLLVQWSDAFELLRLLAAMFNALLLSGRQTHNAFDKCLPLESDKIPGSTMFFPSVKFFLQGPKSATMPAQILAHFVVLSYSLALTLQGMQVFPCVTFSFSFLSGHWFFRLSLWLLSFIYIQIKKFLVICFHMQSTIFCSLPYLKFLFITIYMQFSARIYFL